MLSDCGCSGFGRLSLDGKVKRRQVLRATGAGFIATLTSILVGAGRTARATPLQGSAPTVDRLSVRIVTDIYTDQYYPAAKPEGVIVERAGGTTTPGRRLTPLSARNGVFPCWRNRRAAASPARSWSISAIVRKFC